MGSARAGRPTFKPGTIITQQRRLALLRRFVAGDHTDVGSRTAACLLLLYAQPLSRIQHSPPPTSPSTTASC